MQDQRWQRLQDLFHAASRLAAEGRAKFLAAECGDDQGLRAEVDALLAQDVAGDTVFGEAIEASAAALGRGIPRVQPGEILGAYRIVSQIASGGMAAVYLAERADRQFEQRVAIKFLAPGLFGVQAHERFLAERQILAQLQHPYIAQLLDGGTTGGGMPYLVMEYIEGQSILEYGEARRLDVSERLALFLKVCEAVQYAHQNLVVHRDIKPSNILVTGQGVPKLLDFGIAKLIGHGSIEPGADPSPALTLAEQRLMTPGYASPEQVRGEAVSTATDVYALGVLLYELLCGRFPFDFPSSKLADIERVICQVDPPRPSHKVAGRVRRELAGDLDTIVLCAMRKDPQRRYATVRELAEDIERFLGKRPIRARPDSWRYRAARFAARNRAVLAASLVAFAVIATTVAVYTWRLERARDRATLAAAESEQVTGFLTDLLGDADPWKSPGGNRTAAELLEQGVRDIDRLAGQPAIQARLLYVMGRAYTSLGNFDQAIPLLERSLRLQRADSRADPPAVTAAFIALGHAHRVAGHLPQAERVLRDALAYNEGLPGSPREGTARVLDILGTLLHDMGRSAEAIAMLRRALTLEESLGNPQGTWAADILNNLAISLDAQGQLPEAIATHRRAVALNRKLLGPRHPNLATGIYNLALVLEQADQFAEAEQLKREALAMRRELLGDDHWMVALSGSGLATLLALRGEFPEAMALAERGEAITRRALGTRHAQYSVRARQLASVRFERADYQGAELAARAAVAAVADRPREFGGALAAAQNQLCEALLAQGRLDEARAAIEPAFLTRHSSMFRIAQSSERLMARVLSLEGRFAEAEPLYQHTLAEAERIYGPDNTAVATELMDVAAHHLRAAQFARGLIEARRAYQIYRNAFGESHWRTGEAASMLAELLRADGRFDDSRKMSKIARAALAGTFGSEDPRVRHLAALGK